MQFPSIPLFSRIAFAALAVAASGASQAHIGYGSGTIPSNPATPSTSRNFGTLVNGSGPVTAANRSLTSNFGWADASDQSLAFDASFATTRAAGSDEASWALGGFTTGVDNLYFGDSHKGAAFRFHLDVATTVNISLAGLTGVAGAAGGALTPGFSIYKGLAALSPFSGTQTSADYDFSTASRDQRTSWAQAALGGGFNYLATQGNWNALGDWYSGGDGDPTGTLAQLSLFQYQGSAFSSMAGATVSGAFALGPGDYTIYVGGNDLQSKTLAASVLKFGYSLSVSAVPEPSAALLLLLGVPLLALRRRAARA